MSISLSVNAESSDPPIYFANPWVWWIDESSTPPSTSKTHITPTTTTSTTQTTPSPIITQPTTLHSPHQSTSTTPSSSSTKITAITTEPPPILIITATTANIHNNNNNTTNNNSTINNNTVNNSNNNINNSTISNNSNSNSNSTINNASNVNSTPCASTVRNIGTIKSVPEFWQYFHVLSDFAILPKQTSIQLFREGIQPLWEDPANIRGGRWSIPVPRERCIDLWGRVMGEVIAEAFNGYSAEICGVVLSLKPTQATIRIWNRNAESPLIDEQSAYLQAFLGTEDMLYQAHQPAICDVVKAYGQMKPTTRKKRRRRSHKHVSLPVSDGVDINVMGSPEESSPFSSGTTTPTHKIAVNPSTSSPITTNIPNNTIINTNNNNSINANTNINNSSNLNVIPIELSQQQRDEGATIVVAEHDRSMAIVCYKGDSVDTVRKLWGVYPEGVLRNSKHQAIETIGSDPLYTFTFPYTHKVALAAALSAARIGCNCAPCSSSSSSSYGTPLSPTTVPQTLSVSSSSAISSSSSSSSSASASAAPLSTPIMSASSSPSVSPYILAGRGPCGSPIALTSKQQQQQQQKQVQKQLHRRPVSESIKTLTKLTAGTRRCVGCVAPGVPGPGAARSTQRIMAKIFQEQQHDDESWKSDPLAKSIMASMASKGKAKSDVVDQVVPKGYPIDRKSYGPSPLVQQPQQVPQLSFKPRTSRQQHYSFQFQNIEPHHQPQQPQQQHQQQTHIYSERIAPLDFTFSNFISTSFDNEGNTANDSSSSIYLPQANPTLNNWGFDSSLDD